MSSYNVSNQNMVLNQPQPGGVTIASSDGNWIQVAHVIPGCPPGLEYLTTVDKLQIKQIPSLLEAFTGWETNNKYEIINANGQKVFLAAEETETCMRICCGPSRGFVIHIIDNRNNEIMRVTREFKCCAGCCWCAGCCTGCSFELIVEAPVGNVIGYVKQMGSKWKAHYDILDQNRNCMVKLIGPCCILDGPCCPCDNSFSILNNDESVEIGNIAKVYAGFVREAFTTADNFELTFPIDLNVTVKATLLAATFLIDFMFFEQKTNDNNN